jgi:lipoprotein-releasing system ATP-binding protein
MSNSILELTGLCKEYREGVLVTPVLKNVNFSLGAAETVAIFGASGSGKSTFLQLIGGLDCFTAGEITLFGKKYSQLSDAEKTHLREERIGFVYQFHHLLPELTALENVMLPLMIRKMASAQAKSQAAAILEQVGLAHRLRHKPGELSGGERQRVAIARALVKKPSLLLADEPTGNLDKKSREHVMGLILEMSRECQISLVLVTHDESFAHQMNRVLVMDDGVLQLQ